MARLITPKKSRRKNALGIFLLCFAGVAILGAVAAYAYLVTTRDVLDARNCPIKGPASLTVVLIDATDPFTPRQMEDIRQGIEGLVGALKEHDELHIYTLRPDGSKVRTPDFDQCKPREKGNQLIENTRQVAETFEVAFKDKLEASLAAAVQPHPANESPLLEALADIGVASFGSVPADTPKRLAVVSDLLQNGSGISHYHPPIPTLDQFRRLPNAVALTPRLEGVRYCIKRVIRPETRALQNAAQWDFWEGLFQLSGAKPAPCPPLTSADSVLNSI